MSHRDNERYYWFKLKESLLRSERVDFLMRMKGGAEYILLYQCLCLKLVNNNGVLSVRLGEFEVPYTPEKIAGETKGWFSLDTIRIALDFYKKLGLIYQQNDGYWRITDFENLIGSETHGAERKRIGKGVEKRWKKGGNFPPDIDKEKDIDIRDRYKRKDIEKDKDKDKDIERKEVSNEEVDALLSEFYGREEN